MGVKMVVVVVVMSCIVVHFYILFYILFYEVSAIISASSYNVCPYTRVFDVSKEQRHEKADGRIFLI